MNDQERQIISDIFTRLEGAAAQTREPEAERFIADKVKTQPYAPYAMAQALYVQEEAMKSLSTQLEELKAENEKLKQNSGGFLSSIFGAGQRPAPTAAFGRPAPAQGYAPPPPPPQQGYGQQQPGPWGGGQPGYGQQQGGAPWGGQQAGGGGGFLRSALTTAAGVAGGMVVGNALMNAFSGGHHSTLGSFSNNDMASLGFPDGGSGSAGGAGYQDASFGDGGGVFSDSGAGTQDASFSDGGGVFSDGGGVQDASFDSGGSDFGGGGNDDSWT